MTAERIVVVGAGVAGLRAAERLRELGFGGEVVMVNQERHRPYHRPALSKHLLTGELAPADLRLRSYLPLELSWRDAVSGIRLDTASHVLELRGSEYLRYDGLVIATGVQARRMPGVPAHNPRVHVLRTVDDAVALRRTLTADNGPVAVIGSGFTACEVAATARELGRDVTIVSRSTTLLGRAVGSAIGERVTRLHRENGVRLITGAEVLQWLSQPFGVTMLLSTGQPLTAGCVVVAIGGVPAVDWLRGSNLYLRDGVLCWPNCHVVGASDAVAAGDVAAWPNHRFDTQPRRVEHWLNAVEMGRAAAESLLAGPAQARRFEPVPRFWSEQFGVRIQAAGMPSLGQYTVTLQHEGTPSVTGYLSGHRLVGVLGWDNPAAMVNWTAELERHLSAEPPAHATTDPPPRDPTAALPRIPAPQGIRTDPPVKRTDTPRPAPQSTRVRSS
ncbi:NAD(P)/FAD-dependent oxidoreductase [Amycolatopsis anabasis]|uniref:NAD(P)/FAD-dependent oxidoreductase n=1 Tax=Amycolatopsis anabasis TaxID=1840409 RepID=UPI00131AFBB5|nr:FAD-dependent oxidoreductase [Amycolatopsis anabasis]